MTHTVDIEPLAGSLRVWLDDAVPFVDPYALACSVRFIDRQRIELMGLREPDQSPEKWRSIWRAIRDYCRTHGITEVHFNRRNTGQVRRRIISISQVKG